MADTPLVYLRGKIMPLSEASLKIYDGGIVLGATVTDFARTFRHTPFRLDDHLERFYHSCRYARIMPSEPIDRTRQVSLELLEHHASLVPPEQDLGMIWFITPGEYAIYAGSAGSTGDMTPTFCIHTFSLPFGVFRHYFTDGVHVITPSTRHVPPQCVDPKIKCRSRMHWWLADQETHLVDPKAVTLCLDLDGNVTETSGSNFLIVAGGTVVQPSTRNILPGVSQLTVRELCAQLGIGYEVRDFQVHDVMTADEAFLASTPYCLAPVTRINGVTIGAGGPGPVLDRLLKAWDERVGMDIRGQIQTVDI